MQSLPDTAYQILLKNKGKDGLSFADLYKKVAAACSMSDDEKTAFIGKFYTDLTLDGRFIGMPDNYWDLRERHTFDEYDRNRLKGADLYSTEADVDTRDKEDLEEDAEYDAAMKGGIIEPSDEEAPMTTDGEGYEAKGDDSAEAAQALGLK